MKKLLTLTLLVCIALLTNAQHGSISRKPNNSNKVAVLSTNTYFRVQSALKYGIDNSAYWDFSGSSADKGEKLEIYDLDRGHDRVFNLVPARMDGYYIITNRSNGFCCLDVDGGNGNMSRNGNSLKMYDRHGDLCQQFRFKYLGGGKYKIYSAGGHAFGTKDRKSGNGTRVHLWEDHDGPWMEWYLIDANTGKLIYPEK